VTGMWTLAEDVLNAAKRLGVAASALARQEGAAVHRSIAARYGGSTDRWPLWDGSTEYPAIQDPAAWRLIADFIQGEPCLLLWDPSTEQTVIRIERGQVPRAGSRPGDLGRDPEPRVASQMYRFGSERQASSSLAPNIDTDIVERILYTTARLWIGEKAF
jgi:hypothetical protein